MADLLTEAEAAELLRMPRNTLRYWRSSRRGPSFVAMGRRVFYRRSDLEDFIDSSLTGGAA